ncbi:MAG: serine protease [Pseudolabrys sp.]|nr:serine protease [Pseudolabrys sp.]
MKSTATSEAAIDVFAGIPRDERLKLQAALLWSGDYTGAVKGTDPMLTAVKNFQKRIKAKITGQFTAAERATLLAAARKHEQEFGWSVVADPATGIRIGLPTKMVPHAREAEHGTRWSSRHGEIQVETFRYNEPDIKLPELFAREKKLPATRRVEYSVLRDDNFFISGLQGLKKFSVRAQMRNGEVRGFTMKFDQAMEGIVAPVMVAMASAFSPFPQRSAPFAALTKPVEYGNGLVVSARGHIVSDARLTNGCQVIVAAGLGDADRIADDKDTELALLRVYGPRKFKPLSLARGSAGEKPDAKSAELTLTGIPDPKKHDGDGKLTEIKAHLTDGNAIELRQPVPMAGFTGAAALDSQGRFVGMTEMRNAVLASIKPAAPPVRLVQAETIRAFLDAQHVTAAAAHAGDAKDSIVRIICVRK